ncbi:MAG: alanine--tRNA ligase [Candidatus Cloacimonetes bacterium]|mgnify:FL=1|nr:alanine--tRNA ligase [Candidatus Cloacimonadota bacterium]MBT6993341.1 alanine--tRNA ligase [Candidatus Cloacimonadota bacterium]
MFESSKTRQQFIDFFKNKKHQFVESSSVVPTDDPTLLFTNAGMNQFKDIFLGQKKAEFSRVVNSQKCIRAGGKHNDLDEVGKDGYHHTFFEMLGNWSFGDFYKKEAIVWSWELLTEIWGISQNKLYATVHKSDEESFQIWQNETDIENSHIEYHGDKDNFWEMGETGPCGPCSEIHFDRGVEFCHLQNDRNHECKVNGDCHRYIELWNLVFVQFNRDESGKLSPLSQKFVDTGAGFERLCQVLQNKTSNYETDLFMPIITKIAELAQKPYVTNESGTPHRVIADHIRALTFALADGGMPSNEGRGYVLRRILRRAVRFGKLLNLEKPFLFKLVDVVVQIMGEHFSALPEKKEYIKMIVKAEEERFHLTLNKGLEKFATIVNNLKSSQISGKDAFTLYDTFGFPFDLTQILAIEKNLTVNEIDFKKEMQKQKERAQKAGKFRMTESLISKLKVDNLVKTEFVGYEKTQSESRIRYSFVENKNIILALDKTPFYAEAGGQIADIGKISNDDFEVKIIDVQKENGIMFHFGELISGLLNDKKCVAEIDEDYRKNIARNHTATHLLHQVLKDVLGEHINQKGSFVRAEHLRFDFTNFKQISQNELQIIERKMNAKIRENLPVSTEIMSVETAKKSGAIALFGEKYDNKVRVVSIGDYSKELCGGIHLKFTGEIGFLKILSESSIAAGIRRIEAITGEFSENYFQNLADKIINIEQTLNVKSDSVEKKIQSLISENKELTNELKKTKMKSAGNVLDGLLQTAQIIDGVKVISGKINLENPKMMRQLGDQLKNKIESGIGILFAENNGKVSILVVVTKDLHNKFKAGEIVGKLAKMVDGNGGGRPDMAMAGGKDISKIDEALNSIQKIIQES